MKRMINWDQAKVLYLKEIRFLLPKEFDGSLADALRHLANYLDKDLGRKMTEKAFEKEDYKKDPWNTFVNIVENGFKVFGVGTVYNWIAKTRKWEKLDRKIK